VFVVGAVALALGGVLFWLATRDNVSSKNVIPPPEPQVRPIPVRAGASA
jgi:hypothetical protein